MSVIDTLIFDRTQSDIANDTDKAYIDYKDLNRVEETITYLRNLLSRYGYNSTTSEKEWLISDFRKNEDMTRLRNNIEALRSAYPYLVSPVTPNPIKYESIEEANTIEEILYKINEIIINMTQNFIHCGVANCGQSRVWQQRFRRSKDFASTYAIDKYLPTDTVRMLTTANTIYGGKKTSLGLPIVDTFDDVGGTITAWNDSFNILDSLVGGVTV